MVKHTTTFALCFALSPLYLHASSSNTLASDTPLSFEQAIRIAQQSDAWLTGNVHKQKSVEAMSIAVNTLPDPRMSVGLANLPTNGFDFNQEGMTQAKIGVSQMFPRGDTLAIKSQQLKIQSQAYPYQRKDRASKVAVTVGSLWLEAYRVQESIAIIEKSRSLFEQLADVAEANYSSALGKARQQDIVRAQLELTRLDDRLDQLAQQQDMYSGMLTQWLATVDTKATADYDSSLMSSFALHKLELRKELPEVALHHHELVNSAKWLSANELIPYFSSHPSVLAIDKKITATKTGIDLAKQKYKPEWGVNASYGYRDDDAMGKSRADFFSVGVTFDIPLFTEKRQDNEVKSAISEAESVKTEKVLLLRKLLSSYSSAKGRLHRLKDRQNLFATKLLPQIHDQAEASLTSYTNDDGDFAEVVRSRIAVLNTEIDALTLNVEERKLRLELNYLLVGNIDSKQANTRYFKKSHDQNDRQNAILGVN